MITDDHGILHLEVSIAERSVRSTLMLTYIGFRWWNTELNQRDFSLVDTRRCSEANRFLIEYETIDEFCVFNGSTTERERKGRSADFMFYPTTMLPEFLHDTNITQIDIGIHCWIDHFQYWLHGNRRKKVRMLRYNLWAHSTRSFRAFAKTLSYFGVQGSRGTSMQWLSVTQFHRYADTFQDLRCLVSCLLECLGNGCRMKT